MVSSSCEIHVIHLRQTGKENPPPKPESSLWSCSCFAFWVSCGQCLCMVASLHGALCKGGKKELLPGVGRTQSWSSPFAQV